MKEDPRHGDLYYKLLSTRYFEAYCRSNEDAFLALGMSSSSYYRHIKRAVRMYAAYLWCVVIPDLILKEDLRKEYTKEMPPDMEVGVKWETKWQSTGTEMRTFPARYWELTGIDNENLTLYN